jgi:hypothetical protein
MLCRRGEVAIVFLVGIPEGKRPHGIARRRWEESIRMDLQKKSVDRAWTGLIKTRRRDK